MFGLSSTATEQIRKILREFPDIEMASIYGSRAMGNYKKGSDVDLAIFGSSLKPDTPLGLSRRLNQEAPLPYHFDVTDMRRLDNSDLRHHIQTHGKHLYEKTPSQPERSVKR